ncbi:MAG: galactose-1-phosphate uridylyltransferase [Terriglobales bacterium]
MPEFRQNPITKEWVIIATERARRPDAFVRPPGPAVAQPAYYPECPFCPGNEHMSPAETWRHDTGGRWDVRVVPNKFSALSMDGKRTRFNQGLRHTASGVGIHEVIIETPQHNVPIALMPQEHVEIVMRSYKERYFSASDDPRVELITIFKNHGSSGGASQEHPHSQLIATPIISPQVRSRMETALRHFDEAGDCIFCKVLMDEMYDGKRIINENTHFVSFVPFASLSPFHTWIFPRRHQASFGEIRDDELRSLASILRETLARLYHGLGDPDYNYTIRTAPSENRYCKYYHWYLSLIPRLTKVAGFELGSGFFVNVTLPEENAEYLRGVLLP